ncbi:MAG: PP2C family serine/threonine-protein phosphatase [Burkholderiaceae bacterium]
MRFSIFQDSHIGSRANNQDRMGYCFTRESLLMIVADGMGGHLRGEVAAQITLQTAASSFQQAARPLIADPAGFLDLSLRRAHREIQKFQQTNRLPESPRTTVVACIVQNGHAWWGHAGDSRLYWTRGGSCIGRTEDHSKVQNMANLGLITPEEQETHPERNKVLNCLGSPYEPNIEISGAHSLERGDRIMLCSDGVWSGLPEKQLNEMLFDGPVANAVPRLVLEAVDSLGPGADNATALAMHWDDDSGDEISSHLIPDGAVTTTISVGVEEEAEIEDITEDEIEQTIREIRDAIEKTGGG